MLPAALYLSMPAGAQEGGAAVEVPPGAEAAAPAASQPPPAPEAPVPALSEPSPEPHRPPEDAVPLYLAALEAWNRGQAWNALRQARAALAIDPTLGPARLLEGHALTRLGEREQADAVYTRLLEDGDDTLTAPVRAEAERARRLLRERGSRDQISLFGATELALRPTGDGVSPALGYAAGIDVPVVSLFGVGAEVGAWDPSDSATAVVGGPILDVVATMHAPLAGSPWAVRLKVGPSLWFSQGLITGGEVVPEFGVRSVLGFDSRTWTIGGWFVETGGWFWPGYMDRLPVLAYTWDVRAGVVIWVGPHRR